MNIDKKTQYGGIVLSPEAIASVAGAAASECYGVLGLAPKGSIADQVSILLKVEDYIKGVYVHKGKKGYEVDVYLYCAYGIKLTEVAAEVQKKVKYVLEKTFAIKFSSINVFVQDVRDIEA